MLWPGEFSALGSDNCRDSAPGLGDQACAGNAAFGLAGTCLAKVLNRQVTFAVGSPVLSPLPARTAAASARSSAQGWMRADVMVLAPLCSQSPGAHSWPLCLSPVLLELSLEVVLSQLPSTTPVDSTFPQETGSAQCCGIRGHAEQAVKPQVVLFSPFSLQTQECELSLGEKESISCRCERALCFLAVPAPLPMPGFRSETCSNLSSFSLFAWFYTRKLSQAPLAAGRVVGLSASGDGQWQSWEAGARFGGWGWEPSSAVQAAQVQGQVSVMSSPLWKS